MRSALARGHAPPHHDRACPAGTAKGGAGGGDARLTASWEGAATEGRERLDRLPAAKRALAERLLAARDRDRVLPIPRRDRAGPVPLTYQQRRVWARERAAYRPTSAIPAAMRLQGELDAGALEAAWHHVCARHQALRTVFLDRDDEVHQEATGAEPPFRRESLEVAPGRYEAELDELAAAELKVPFDLGRGPLARARLLRLAHQEHGLLVTVHHLVNDAWSQQILFRELRHAYRALRGGGDDPAPEPALQYADYAAWQHAAARSGRFRAHLEHWARLLAGAPGGLDLPLRGAPPAAELELGCLGLRLPAATTAGIRQLARSAGASLFMALLAAYATALAEMTRQDEVVVGTPAAARTRTELEGVMGLFVNLVPLRLGVRPGASFAELLGRARAAATDAFARQEVPLDLVLESTGARPPGPGRAPLFQALFVLQNVGERMARQAGPAPVERPAQPALPPFLPFYSPSWASFDVAVQLTEGPNGLVGNLEYDAGRLPAGAAEELRARLLSLLERVAVRPEGPAAEG